MNLAVGLGMDQNGVSNMNMHTTWQLIDRVEAKKEEIFQHQEQILNHFGRLLELKTQIVERSLDGEEPDMTVMLEQFKTMIMPCLDSYGLGKPLGCFIQMAIDSFSNPEQLLSGAEDFLPSDDGIDINDLDANTCENLFGSASMGPLQCLLLADVDSYVEFLKAGDSGTISQSCSSLMLMLPQDTGPVGEGSISESTKDSDEESKDECTTVISDGAAKPGTNMRTAWDSMIAMKNECEQLSPGVTTSRIVAGPLFSESDLTSVGGSGDKKDDDLDSATTASASSLLVVVGLAAAIFLQ